MINVQIHKYATGISLVLFVVFGIGLTRFPSGYVATAAASLRTTAISQASAGITSTSYSTKTWNETAGTTTYGYYAANVAKNGSNINFKGSNSSSSKGYIYNTSSGGSKISRISSITLTQTGTARAWIGYFGTSKNPTGNSVSKNASSSITWTVTGAYNYFKLVNNGGNNKTSTVTGISISFYPLLSSISIKTQPTTKAFYVGQTFSSAGMVISQNYADGTTASSTGWTTNYDNHVFTSSDIGTKTVTVSYTEPSSTSVTTVTKTTSYSITVAYPPLNSIYTSYTSGEGVDRYVSGDTFHSVAIYATWGYGANTLVTSSCVFSISGVTKAPGSSTVSGSGIQTVNVSYTDPLSGGTRTTTYPIYLYSLNTLSISTYPTYSVVGGTSFGLGTTFTSSGLVLSGTYGFSGYPDIVRSYSSGFSLSSPNMMLLGEQSVTASFGGKTVSYSINITNLGKASGVTDAQQANAMATYVLALNACGLSADDVSLMVEEYDYMTVGAKALFDAMCDGDGLVYTGTGAKDRYDYILYLDQGDENQNEQLHDFPQRASTETIVGSFGAFLILVCFGVVGYAMIQRKKRA